MTTKNNGGPAFPDPGRSQSVKQRELLGNPGMSLRDYFAAKAMQGAFSSPIAASEREQQYIAMHAYRMADAMIKARDES